MTAWLTLPWTSALKVAKIGLGEVGDSEEPIMMQNISNLFRHIRKPVEMLLALIADAFCYLGLCLRPAIVIMT